MTCLLDLIEYSTHSPKKYEFDELEKVSVKCNKGFQLVGARSLTCTASGKFDQPLPLCVGKKNNLFISTCYFGLSV